MQAKASLGAMRFSQVSRLSGVEAERYRADMTSVSHIAFTVSDLLRSIEFWTEDFDAQVVQKFSQDGT